MHDVSKNISLRGTRKSSVGIYDGIKIITCRILNYILVITTEIYIDHKMIISWLEGNMDFFESKSDLKDLPPLLKQELNPTTINPHSFSKNIKPEDISIEFFSNSFLS